MKTYSSTLAWEIPWTEEPRELRSMRSQKRRIGLSTHTRHRLSCSVTCEIFLDQGSNLCLLHWQADSLPLSHLGSPIQGLLAYIWLRIVSLMYVWLSQSDFESRDKFYTLCLLWTPNTQVLRKYFLPEKKVTPFLIVSHTVLSIYQGTTVVDPFLLRPRAKP